MDTQEAKQTAEMILRQLGGHKFAAMTGANWFMSYPEGALSFRLPHPKINYVKITLNRMDLYDMEFRFVQYRKGVIVNNLIAEHTDVYNDQLRRIFERETGLRTSLTAVYG